MKSARHTPCSQTGLEGATAADEERPASRRIRRAVEGYANAIVRIIGESYGRNSVQYAWREFTIGRGDEFLGDDPNAELFFSWLFHRWSPDSKSIDKIDDESCYGVPPTRAYLARNASELDPLRRRYLEACLAGRFSFYEILDCKPHIGFRARDVLTGREVELSEGIASTSVRSGDVVFAHIVSVDGTAMMEAISPISFPPTLKAELMTLSRYPKRDEHEDLPLRRLYFRLLESYRCLPMPEVQNGEGEVIEPHVLYFDIESPQRAFDSLAPLALSVTRRKLLDGAKYGVAGILHEATIPWLESRDSKVAALGTVLMGYIHICGRKLIVEVDSPRRARAFRQLMRSIPTATARYRSTRKQPFDRALLSASNPRDLRLN